MARSGAAARSSTCRRTSRGDPASHAHLCQHLWSGDIPAYLDRRRGRRLRSSLSTPGPAPRPISRSLPLAWSRSSPATRRKYATSSCRTGAATSGTSPTQRAIIGQDAQVNSLNVALGSRLSKSLIAGQPGRSRWAAEMLGLYFADENQHIDHQTRQMHISPYCTSDLLFKGAIKDRARHRLLGPHQSVSERPAH